MNHDASALEPDSPGTRNPWQRRGAPKLVRALKPTEKAAVLEEKTRAVLEEKMRSVLRRWQRRTAWGTPDELDAQIAGLRATNHSLGQTIEALTAENAALKEELAERDALAGEVEYLKDEVADSQNREALAGEAVHWEAQRREAKLRVQLEQTVFAQAADLATAQQQLSTLQAQFAREAWEGRDAWCAGMYACAVRELTERPVVLRPPGTPRPPRAPNSFRAALEAAASCSGVAPCGAELQRVGPMWVLVERGGRTVNGLQRGAYFVEVARRSGEVKAVLVRPGVEKMILQIRVAD